MSVDLEDVARAADQLWIWLYPSLKYLSDEDREVVQLAFLQMVESHGEQRRKSGEFYIIHPVSACKTLAKMKIDKATLAACLMHDVPEDTETTIATIQKNFGGEIAFLVNGVTKLGTVKYRGDERYAENLRKMFIAMSEDLRVIFIKLADRIHNLETIDHLRPDKAHRIALESVNIYARIAQRLGIDAMHGRIEDLCFPVLYPDKYKEFIYASDIEINKRKRYLEDIQTNIRQLLEKNHYDNLKITGRAKRYFSIFNKIQTHGGSLDQITDLVAIRVITKTVGECYEIFSLLHAHLDVIEGRTKDYIAQPKSNGYQSLHASCIDKKSGSAFEIQIRTKQMHEFAEYGVAAHWAYKQNGDVANQFSLLNNKWIQELVELGSEPLNDEEYLKRIKLDLYKDRIFVMTPKGDAIDLPAGSVTLDFAFRVHEELGMHAVMAKINGKPVKLTDQLQSGDIVEIITDRKQEPKLDWLNHVTTVNAARKIRSHLRKLGHEI